MENVLLFKLGGLITIVFLKFSNLPFCLFLPQEKIKAWKLKRQKPRKNSGHSSFDVDVPDRNVMSPESEYVPPSTIVKSRSLESLRDSLSNSREDLLDVTAPEEVRFSYMFMRGYD